jgi:1-acyl-sn-glycerol-3-phosphate acyltransferase
MMASAAVSGHPSHWALLGNRNFMLLWCAYGVSAMGDHLSEMAILKTQNIISSDVDVTPLDARMTFLFFVPFLLFAPLMGFLADRLPRRGLMVVADGIRFGLMLALATLIGWCSSMGSWGPFLPMMLIGVFAAMFSPARSALLPTLIRPDQLVQANGMIGGLGWIGTMVAVYLGGYLAAHYEPVVAFRIDAMTFAASALFLLAIRAPRQDAVPESRIGMGGTVRDMAGGFGYVRSHRRVLELLLVAALIWFCGPLVKCVIPAVVRDVYGGGYQAMSVYRAFLGIGFIAGAGAITLLGNALRSEVAITWSLIGIGLSIAIFASSVFLPFAPGTLAIIGALGVIGAGAAGITAMTSLEALLQRIVPDHFRGRVFGVRDVVTAAALLLATGALGLPQNTRVDQWVGYILILVAALTIAAGLMTLHIRLGRSGLGRRLSFALNFNEMGAKFLWRVKCVGRCTVPRHGPMILTANHVCSADPLFICSIVRFRSLSFMVAAEYVNWPIAGWFMRSAECIPVKRGTRDTSPTKTALRFLREGKAVGIFIEGGIVAPGEQVEPKDGVSMLALRTGAEVYPIHISGARHCKSTLGGLFAKHRPEIRFGKPVDLGEFRGKKADRETLRAATAKIFSAIHALAPKDDDLPTSSNNDSSGRLRS